MSQRRRLTLGALAFLLLIVAGAVAGGYLLHVAIAEALLP